MPDGTDTNPVRQPKARRSRRRAQRHSSPGELIGGPRAPGPGRSEPEPGDVTRSQALDPHALDRPAMLEMIRCAEMEIVGRLVEASNITLYGRLLSPGGSGLPPGGVSCVYKPVRGERPLWDFPRGTLSRREVAAFVLSEATGWEIVPPTVWRDGPFGPGMVQLWIDADESVDLLALVRGADPALRRMALYDAVANNADRKGGHLLPVAGGHVYGVDHGICFHSEPKLRTILWGWRGSSLSAGERTVLREVRAALDGDLGNALAELLAEDEVIATRQRVDELLEDGRFPEPDPDRPAIPWPPF